MKHVMRRQTKPTHRGRSCLQTGDDTITTKQEVLSAMEATRYATLTHQLIESGKYERSLEGFNEAHEVFTAEARACFIAADGVPFERYREATCESFENEWNDAKKWPVAA